MALPSTGSLSFSQIEREFGRNDINGLPNRTLGQYRISQTVGQIANMPISEGIGQEKDDSTSNSIRFSQFRGARLNVVLQYNSKYGTFSDPDIAPGAQEKYQSAIIGTGVDDEVVVVGNLKKVKPPNGGGKRIIIHVTSTIGGGKRNIGRNKCSLVTGNGWANDTELHINVGETGEIAGTGGFGGQRGGKGEHGEDGEDGSSAIGINYTGNRTKIIVQNGGQVRAGGGGGGGGGGAKSDTSKSRGGDGGAGAGIPDHKSGTDDQFRTKARPGLTGDASGDAAGGGGGGGGVYPGGTPGEGGGITLKTGDNPDNTQAIPGQDGTTSGGGAGGKGDAEGQDQFEGVGGIGGLNGFAIARVIGIDAPDIVDPSGGIKGDIVELSSIEKAQKL